MAKRQGENSSGPSYTSLTPVFYENKSLRKSTEAFRNTSESSAIRPGARVTKETRKTGKKA